MPFDPILSYPRATVAQSLAACQRAVRDEQLDHSDLALPASNVTHRLTTAEAIALVAANHARSLAMPALLGYTVWNAGGESKADWRVRFTYAKG